MRTTRFLISILFVTISISAIGQSLRLAQFDKRLELTAIAYRLTSEYEANNYAYSAYAADVDKHFNQLKNHPLIAFLADKSSNTDLASLCEIALHLNIDHQQIKLDDAARFEHSNRAFCMQYVSLLQDFYNSSDFEKFYNAHSHYYSAAEKVYNDIINAIDTKVINEMLKTDLTNVSILLNSFSGAYSYTFPRDKAIVLSGFADCSVGNAKSKHLGCNVPCGEKKIVYLLAELELQSTLHALTPSVLEASTKYFEASTSNYFKPHALYGEYYKQLLAVYYLQRSKHPMAQIEVRMSEGGQDQLLLPLFSSLLPKFAELLDQGYAVDIVPKFAKIYSQQAPTR